VTIHWEENTGLDIKIKGSNGSMVDVMVDQPVPGFVPSAGNVFAWSARTGGLNMTVQLDNIVITTVPVLPIQTGGPVISEILVDNASFGEDENCDSGSWVEIYNGQATSQSLNGWYLTNAVGTPAKWAFPASITLAPYQYMVVWVDSKNRITTPLHTNFSLVKAGGYVGLVKPDLSTASSFTYGPQAEDVSYGRLGQAQTEGYFETPTAGVKNSGNQTAGTPTMEEITFDRVGGLFSTAFTLNITPPVTLGAVARYTLDNSVPTAASPEWPVGGLSVTGSTNLRVRFSEAGKLLGPVSSRSFTLLDSSLTNYRGTGQPFKSNLPILVFNSYGINIDGAGGSPGLRPYRSTYGMSINTDPGNGDMASITGPIDMQNRGGTHIRGETSAGFAQKPYAWEVWDNKERDKAVSLLGWPVESDYVLISNYNDKSVTRNMMPFEMMRRINGDGSAMRERYVEVFFKQDGAGPLTYNDYRGIYILTEKIKRDKGRVDIEKLDPCDGVFTGNPAVDDVGVISGGYIIRKDKASPEAAFTTNGGGGFPAQTLQIVEPNTVTTAQGAYIKDYVNRFEGALYGANFTDPVNGYAKYIDVDSYIEGHLWVEIFKQIDGYRLSTYMYKDRGGKLKYAPLWDYNLSLGNANYNDGMSPTNWYYLIYHNTVEYPYHQRLFQDPAFKRRYWDRYWQLRRGPFSNANVNATIEGYMAQLKGGVSGSVTNGSGAWPTSTPSVENPIGRHNARWQRLGLYDWPNADSFALRTTWESPLDYTTINNSTAPLSQVSETAFVKVWLIRRLMWMDSMSTIYGSNTGPGYLPPNYSHYGGLVSSSYNLVITDPNAPTPGTIFYTLDGSDPITSGISLTPSTAISSETGNITWLRPDAGNGGTALTAGAGANQWTALAAPPNIANWSTGTGGIGYDYNDPVTPGANDVLFGPYIGTNINPGSTGCAGAYARIPFAVTTTQISGMSALKLKLRYDDAAVIYLNGLEVARRNFNGTPTFSSVSVTSRPGGDAMAVLFEEIDLTASKNLLVDGSNMLAIHVINATSSFSAATGKDLLLQPRLEATIPSQVILNSSTQVKARVLDANGNWSPVTDFNFIVDAVPASAANIVVSELNYNPLPPTPAETLASGANNDNDFEFIEIHNISNQTVDLTECSIEGVSFFWTAAPTNRQSIPAGGRMVIVENSAAFAVRYAGKNATVAGEFVGNLSKAGQLITLRAKNGSIIKSFTYDDEEPWPVDADNNGYTLVLNNPSINPDHSMGRNWRSSAVVHGCPGATDGVVYTGSPTADTDLDGIRDIVEVALGSDPNDGNQTAWPTVEYAEFDTGNGAESHLTFTYNTSLNADAVRILPEVSSDLAAWQASGISLTYVGTTNNGNGTATTVLRSTLPIAALPPRLFARITVEPAVP
jgi:hypothetical protein